MNDKERIRELLGAVESTFAIECIPCGNGTNAMAHTEWSAAKEFDEAGWRIVENEAHCPDCIKADAEFAQETQVTRDTRDNNDSLHSPAS